MFLDDSKRLFASSGTQKKCAHWYDICSWSDHPHNLSMWYIGESICFEWPCAMITLRFDDCLVQNRWNSLCADFTHIQGSKKNTLVHRCDGIGKGRSGSWNGRTWFSLCFVSSPTKVMSPECATSTSAEVFILTSCLLLLWVNRFRALSHCPRIRRTKTQIMQNLASRTDFNIDWLLANNVGVIFIYALQPRNEKNFTMTLHDFACANLCPGKHKSCERVPGAARLFSGFAVWADFFSRSFHWCHDKTGRFFHIL